MLITCYKHVDGYIDDVYNVRPNPTDYLGVCGAPFVAEQTDRCNVTQNNSSWRKEFIATGNICNDCKKEKEGCHWQIRKHHVFLYSPTKKKYVQYEYISDSASFPTWALAPTLAPALEPSDSAFDFGSKIFY